MSKPLGHKSYGSIPNLPGGQLGRGDYRIHEGQARILTEKTRDRHDTIVLQEKLDGSNVAVARIDGQLVPITRAGYVATSSKFEQHQLFAHWVRLNLQRFDFLKEGERVAGEWLAQAHGTRYEVTEDNVFVAFDLMTKHQRAPYQQLVDAVAGSLTVAPALHVGGAISVEAGLELLGVYGVHGALDPAEGLVYRCERQGKVEFLAKYVRPEFVPGRYLPEIGGHEAVWNWRPTAQPA